MAAEVFGWLLVLFVLLIAGFMGVMYLRKWLNSTVESETPEPFTLGDLRSLLKQRKLTQEEFDRLRDQTIAVARKNAPDPLAGRKSKSPPPDAKA